MTLNEIGQQALSEIGSVVVPTSVAGDTRLFNLAKRSMKSLVTRLDWDELVDRHQITTDGTDTYDLPSDFGSIVIDSVWDETNDRFLKGPVEAAEWQSLRLNSPTANIKKWFRIGKDRDSLTRSFLLFPTPGSGDTITFEYVSNKPVKDANDALQETFIDDTDEPRIDPDIVVLDLKWRYLRSVGLPYSEEFRDLEQALQARMSETGAQTYNQGGRRLVRRFQTQEGDFTL